MTNAQPILLYYLRIQSQGSEIAIKKNFFLCYLGAQQKDSKNVETFQRQQTCQQDNLFHSFFNRLHFYDFQTESSVIMYL